MISRRIGYTETTPTQRLQLALEMSAFGIEMRRTQLRRENPEASDEEIQQLMRQWFHQHHEPPYGYYQPVHI